MLRRHRTVDANHRAALRVEHVVARIAQHAAENLRQLDLREQAIDQQLILRRDLLVEQLGVVEGVAAGDREGADAARVVGGHAAAVEAEARTPALLDEGGELRVAGRAERARLAEGEQAAVVVEAVAAVIGRIGPDRRPRAAA